MAIRANIILPRTGKKEMKAGRGRIQLSLEPHQVFCRAGLQGFLGSLATRPLTAPGLVLHPQDLCGPLGHLCFPGAGTGCCPASTQASGAASFVGSRGVRVPAGWGFSAFPFAHSLMLSVRACSSCLSRASSCCQQGTHAGQSQLPGGLVTGAAGAGSL